MIWLSIIFQIIAFFIVMELYISLEDENNE